MLKLHMPKKRLDILLVERGLVESRTLAQRFVMAGQVRVNEQVVLKPSTKVLTDAHLEIDQGPPFVSRGGEKLAAALEAFKLDVGGRICADLGASTGGFTDCLLQNGAQRVYAIDVGKGVLHWKLRNDRRVVVMEGTNARHVERLPEAVEIITIDASFISLKILLPVVKGWFTDPTQVGSREAKGDNAVIALIKPQFEAGRAEVGRGEGVIRDPEVHNRVLFEVLRFSQAEGYIVRALMRSPLIGPKGNIEFLAWLNYPPENQDLAGGLNLDEVIPRLISKGK
jgi:23S rRNA (cytidine1920-2'-O)/16S rRNA (cytidine1409-2'-O)-methyltransferase